MRQNNPYNTSDLPFKKLSASLKGISRKTSYTMFD